MNKYSKHKHVSFDKRKRNKPWVAEMDANGYHWYKYCETEHDAAIAVDKKLIEIGKSPVNLLRKAKNQAL